MANSSAALLCTLLLLTSTPLPVAGGPMSYGLCLTTCYALLGMGLITSSAATGSDAPATGGVVAPIVAAVGTAMATSGSTFAACSKACAPLAVAPST